MKGSKLPKLAALLLVLTLATTCFVSGIFAKYVSEGDGEDAARVAKWGVKVEIAGDGFKTTYGKDEVNANVDGPTVVSSTTEKVVAPGTSGTFGGISITGKPEVAVKIETTADVKLDGWNIAPGGEFCCPLVFTIGDTKINGLDYSSTTAGGEGSFESAIKTAIQNATTKEYEAGTDLSAAGEGITYSWTWPFQNATGTATNQDDELDTLLGDNAANGQPATISITVTTTVTQID